MIPPNLSGRWSQNHTPGDSLFLNRDTEIPGSKSRARFMPSARHRIENVAQSHSNLPDFGGFVRFGD